MVGEKLSNFDGAFFQSLRAHRLELPQRLLAASQRQRQAMVMILGKRNEARMAHGEYSDNWSVGVMEYWSGGGPLL
jgi:hypothetical protein